MIWLPESCAQILDEFAVGAYLEDIARRLGAVEIIHKDKQTTTLFAPPNMLGYDADTGKWLGDPNSVEIRTPLWNLIMNGREETVPITTRMSPLG